MFLSYGVTDVKSLITLFTIWQMLLPFNKWQILSTQFICGRCYKPLWQMELPFNLYLFIFFLADVIAICLSGRCFND